jgi:hypothetical protein
MTTATTATTLTISQAACTSPWKQRVKTCLTPFVAGSGPWADLRTSGSILACSAYVVAKQLYQLKHLDSFGTPMAMFAVASGTSIAAALDGLRKTDNLESPPPQPPLAVRVLAPALALCGSFGLFTHWMLSLIQQTSTPAFHALVPLTFFINSLVRLSAETQGLSARLLTQTKPFVVAGTLIGAGLFQHAALQRMQDPILFGLSSMLTASLIPTFIGACKSLMAEPKQPALPLIIP